MNNKKVERQPSSHFTSYKSVRIKKKQLLIKTMLMYGVHIVVNFE